MVVVPTTQPETCHHPELMSWHDNLFPNDWYYVCKSCPTRIKIPLMSILIEEDSKHRRHREATIAARQRCVDLIGQTFGEQWRERIQQEANQWNAKETILPPELFFDTSVPVDHEKLSALVETMHPRPRLEI